MQPLRTLLNLSGGIDSLYCLWDYARRREPLLIHFCELINWTGRHKHEVQAVQKIIEWIDRHEPFRYKLLQTRYDYGNTRIVQDKEVIGFITGTIIRDPRIAAHLQNIIISSNRQDISRTPYYVRTEADRLRLIEGVGRKRLKYIYPIGSKTKAKLIRELPPDLLRLAWFCRTPNQGRPCKKCQTCTKVLPVFQELNIEPA